MNGQTNFQAYISGCLCINSRLFTFRFVTIRYSVLYKRASFRG